MKLQAITLIAVFSGIIASTSADAGEFNFGDALRTAQKIHRVVHGPQYSGQNPGYGGGTPGCVKPLSHPGYLKPPVCHTPVHKPICQPSPPVCPPVCVLPINRPPVTCFTMKLVNNSGADVYYNLNHSDQSTQITSFDTELINSHSPQPHLIRYHNGQEAVEFQLDPSASYRFEWQGQTLVLLQTQV